VRAADGELFAGVFEASPDAIVVTDAAGTVVAANERCTVVFGHAPEGLVGVPIEVLVPARLRAGHPQRRDSFARVAGRRPMGLLELVAMRADGSEFPAEISLAQIDVDGVRYVCATVRDITERRRIQETADRIRDELMATVSHELRTPLTSIVGYTELLGDLGEEEVGPRARRMLDVIDRNARRELRLVNDLLTLAQVRERGLSVALTEVDLESVVRGGLEDARLAARRRGVTLVVERDAGSEVRVRGDQERLAQVVDNLLTNAVKFTPPGGRVTVVLRGADGAVHLDVVDTGAGMAPEEAAQVFDRLYRAPSAVADQVPGAGLGLSIAKAVVEAHGGTIAITSEPERGSTLSVVLPAASR
jgi:protein-histidine pros-kinase